MQHDKKRKRLITTWETCSLSREGKRGCIVSSTKMDFMRLRTDSSSPNACVSCLDLQRDAHGSWCVWSVQYEHLRRNVVMLWWWCGGPTTSYPDEGLVQHLRPDSMVCPCHTYSIWPWSGTPKIPLCHLASGLSGKREVHVTPASVHQPWACQRPDNIIITTGQDNAKNTLVNRESCKVQIEINPRNNFTKLKFTFITPTLFPFPIYSDLRLINLKGKKFVFDGSKNSNRTDRTLIERLF